MGTSLVIGVLGASGGVGTSTFVAGLARCAARANRGAVCIDARPASGGLEVIVGTDQTPGLRWADLLNLRGPVTGHRLLAELPSAADVRVLSWGPAARPCLPTPAVEAVLDAVSEEGGVCTVDLPPLDHPALPVLVPYLSALVLVAGATLPALAAVTVAASALPNEARDRAWLCQRGPRGSTSIGEVVAALAGLPLAGIIPDDRHVTRDLQRGVPPASHPGAFSRSCAEVLAALASSQPGPLTTAASPQGGTA